MYESLLSLKAWETGQDSQYDQKLRKISKHVSQCNTKCTDLDELKMKECLNRCSQPQKQAEIFIYTKKKKFFDMIATYYNNLPSDMSAEGRKEELHQFKSGEELLKDEILNKLDAIIEEL
ncbi:unnamed protein product [Moneuplotes crassus]|uniref:Uncharacterized protein n=1 Tax=Euplotes crassus TaxID=5936 RepID=A0AAD1Y1S2_EUPCR|nr:unnamed protein product [Moneuplotes crassus]